VFVCNTDDALVREGQRPEFSGQRKGQQKVLGGDLFLHLALQPLLALVVLTVRAVAVTAGVRYQFLMVAIRAFDLHLRAGLRAAILHRRHCARVLGPESAPVLRQEVGPEGFDHGRQPDHLTFPQSMEKLSIRPLIRSMA